MNANLLLYSKLFVIELGSIVINYMKLNRNYYKCSTGGCQVKKRVERDREDSSYVLTTYEGVHTHESPCIAYDYNYNNFHHQDHQTAQNCWSLQASSSPPSSSSS